MEIDLTGLLTLKCEQTKKVHTPIKGKIEHIMKILKNPSDAEFMGNGEIKNGGLV